MNSRQVQALIEEFASRRDDNPLMERVFQALVKYKDELFQQECRWQAELDAPLG